MFKKKSHDKDLYTFLLDLMTFVQYIFRKAIFKSVRDGLFRMCAEHYSTGGQIGCKSDVCNVLSKLICFKFMMSHCVTDPAS